MKLIADKITFQSPGISEPIRLFEDTEISDVLIEVSWNKEELDGRFIVEVYYFNDNKPMVSMTYKHENPVVSSQLLFISRQQALHNKGFMCKTTKIKCEIKRIVDKKMVPIDINVAISKFEGDEKENHWLILESKLPRPDNFPEIGDM